MSVRGTARSGGRSTSGRTRRLLTGLLCVAAFVVIASACGGDDKPELTLEDRLEALEGRPMTAVEVADRLNVASALCALDEPVLDAVWRRLSEDQLAFQDFVFAHICPDRSIFYAGLTGRYVTEEAQNSGVVTSTTPPIRTTTTEEPATTLTTTNPLGSITPGDSTDASVVPGDNGATSTPDAETGVTTTTAASPLTTPPEGEGG